MSRITKTLMFYVFAFPLVLMSIEKAYAGNESPEPPSGAERVTGPPIEAVLTATFDAGTSQASIVIVGSCKKTPIALGPIATSSSPALFAGRTLASVENIRLVGAAPAGCFSAAGGETLLVTGVTKFNNTGVALGADVSLSAVEPK